MSNLITEKKLNFTVPPGKKKERIDLFLTHSIENATRSKIQKLIEAGFVLVNGKEIKQNYKLLPGDILDVTIPISPRPENAEPENIPLSIVYEDDFFIIVNKPPGMVAHPAFGNYTGTLVNALLHHTKTLSNLNEPGRPGIVHRIDKDTSGLLIVAKDDVTHALLAKQFAKHTIEREYWAIAWGLFKEKEGEINLNITRCKSDRKKFSASLSEGKTATTFYSVIEEFEFLTLVKLNLKTGRTHQIRVHLSAINHPIFGDPVYGGRNLVYSSQQPKFKSSVENLLNIIQRQALHAKTLGIYHPHKKEFVRFDSQLPDDMQNLLNKLRKS
ncbi:MAG TPA: RluA family pseudouridine synthase [Ignavibacteriaceae bacterium]|jgi:23S rRNA pseudouridine1911/1915/1917 synthase|nr:RluA family pseudouridine synthase [Ignavibacteriaceae bacterium]